MQAPASGGATPIADARAVLKRLPEQVMKKFANRGWRLVRSYGTGFGLSVEKAFGTVDRQKVEEYCRSADVSAEWSQDGILRTTQTRPVTAVHPVTGERSWFNHIVFWHSSTLEPDIREALISELGPDFLPFNTCYGDGAPIPDEIVAEIADAYQAEKFSRLWRAGDVMIIENMLVAHGREAFTGERRVVVAMGDECRCDGTQ
jgi:Taurine catabolism dioxygenase TauD, TfdA family